MHGTEHRCIRVRARQCVLTSLRTSTVIRQTSNHLRFGLHDDTPRAPHSRVLLKRLGEVSAEKTLRTQATTAIYAGAAPFVCQICLMDHTYMQNRTCRFRRNSLMVRPISDNIYLSFDVPYSGTRLNHIYLRILDIGSYHYILTM